MSIEKRIQELGLVLPKVPAPAANYANAVRMGSALYLSGIVPARADGTIPKGKVGADVSTEEAVEHARLAALNILAILRGELGEPGAGQACHQATWNGQRSAGLPGAFAGDQRGL